LEMLNTVFKLCVFYIINYYYVLIRSFIN